MTDMTPVEWLETIYAQYCAEKSWKCPTREIRPIYEVLPDHDDGLCNVCNALDTEYGGVKVQ